MAANQIREMTKDADLSAHRIDNDEEGIREIVASDDEGFSHWDPRHLSWL